MRNAKTRSIAHWARSFAAPSSNMMVTVTVSCVAPHGEVKMATSALARRMPSEATRLVRSRRARPFSIDLPWRTAPEGGIASPTFNLPER